MGDTTIQWTDVTWNCVRGCSRVSAGCGDSTGGGCYAERQAFRFSGPGMPYEGLVKMTPKGPRWTGRVILVPEKLEEPLRWRKPRRIFVNSMSDLFHEALSDTQIQNVFSVMESARHHIYQVLTKRPQRMLDFVTKFDEWLKYASDYAGHLSFEKRFPHVWLGVSCEDQKTADERIPLLLDTPAAVRWISAEPLLGPIDLNNFLYNRYLEGGARHMYNQLDWVVVGGESGPKSRQMNLGWARSIVKQCNAASVPVFVKQLGLNPVFHWTEEASAVGLTLGPNMGGQIYPVRLKDKKGGDINEWPNDLRVREFPVAA